MTDISKKLSIVISKSGLSYAKLETKTGIAKSSLQRYATGKTKKIPTDAIKLIAEATNSSFTWILGMEKNEKDIIASITNRLEEDSSFLQISKFLYQLNDKQLRNVLKMFENEIKTM